MIKMDPNNSAYYQANLATFEESMDEVAKQIVDLATPIKSQPFVPLHDAWHYYAEEFELNLVDNFFPRGGHESTPQHLAELTEKVEKLKINAIFSEIGLDVSSVQGFANDNNVTIGELDPVGGSPGMETYQDFLLENMSRISESIN